MKAYYCLRSHIGLHRRVNQDNFLVDGRYMDPRRGDEGASFGGSFCGMPQLTGVFDGMGGEEQGEIAAYLAARDFSEKERSRLSGDELIRLCRQVNRGICGYAQRTGVFAMGTTAALLYMDGRRFTVCNVGDSRVYRFSKGRLEKLSVDHVAAGSAGMKPPLLQNLGIPEDVFLIEPTIVKASPKGGDVFLLCTDGLTDMVGEDETSRILSEHSLNEAADLLLEAALSHGGRDNVTLLLISVEKNSFFSRLADRRGGRNEQYS